MRLLAIGDIHGCFKSLETLERAVPITSDDEVVALGDYVDRGPQSREVLAWVRERHGKGLLVPLLGNHEWMMLAAREDEQHYEGWLWCGGDATLQSYVADGEAGRLSDVPDGDWDFMQRACRPYYETETHFFVHANADPQRELGDQTDTMLYWTRFNDPPRHLSGKTMVCGHTPQFSGLPRSIGHAICIDTNACRDGWLTCLDVTSGKYWQANEAGDAREAALADH